MGKDGGLIVELDVITGGQGVEAEVVLGEVLLGTGGRGEVRREASTLFLMQTIGVLGKFYIVIIKTKSTVNIVPWECAVQQLYQ